MEFWKLGLAAGAAWLGYEYLTGGSIFAPAATTTTTTATPDTTSVAPAGTTSTAVSQLQAQANAGAMLTVSQWNWYARQDDPTASIIVGPGSSATANTVGNNPISYATYVSLFSTGVQTSLTGLGNLGMIIDLQSIFSGKTDPTGFGDEEFRAGLGMLEDEPANSAAYVDIQPILDAAGLDGSLDSTTQVFYDAVKA